MFQQYLQRLSSVDAEFTYDDITAGLGDKVHKALAALGLMREIALATQVVCDACPDGHWEKVNWSADSTRAFIRCPTEGAVNIDRERLRRWQTDPSQLANLLTRGLDLSGQVEVIPPHRAWLLGQRPIMRRNCYFFFAAIGPDELSPVLQEIRLEYGQLKGTLLLPFAPDVTHHDKLIFLHLSNVISLKGRRIAVDASYIEEQFTGSRREQPQGVRGNDSTCALRAYRLRILKAYSIAKELDGMDAVARSLGVSKSALYGMVRGERLRYSEEKLSVVLTKIGCSPEQWNHSARSAISK